MDNLRAVVKPWNAVRRVGLGYLRWLLVWSCLQQRAFRYPLHSTSHWPTAAKSEEVLAILDLEGVLSIDLSGSWTSSVAKNIPVFKAVIA